MDTSTELYDLQGPAHQGLGYSQETNREQLALPRADGGKDAWLFLTGCFIVEALIWGFPFSFGIFQDYYSRTPPFSFDADHIAVIGTVATGLMYLTLPLIFAVFAKWPHFRRYSVWVGVPLIAIALIGASFANTVAHLIALQGVLYAIGGLFVYAPTFVFMEEWFVRRKGLAFGIMWAGAGVSGVVMPFILNASLEKYGFRTVLRGSALVIVVLCAPMPYLVKARVPLPTTYTPRPFDLSFLRTSTFWLMETGNIIEGLGYFIPSIYLPLYAQSLGTTSIFSTLTVVFVNISSVVGGILVGVLCDRMEVTNVVMLSSVGTVISVFFVWGFSISLPAVAVFSLLYGLFAGGYSTTWAGIIKEVQKRANGADSGIVFGCLAAGRGVGAVASGFLSEALLHSSTQDGMALGYGSDYGSLIIFTGITAALGGVGWIGRTVGWI